VITVIDNFTPFVDDVRASALASGFGTWRPSKGEVGSSIYDGMNFWGKHSLLLHALCYAMGRQVYPNSMFFRVTNEDTEGAYVHSDRESGDFTCIVYLSQHDDMSGTGFYRHRETGMTHMPSFAEMSEWHRDAFDKFKHEMVDGSDEHWEQLDFVRGLYNRAVIFDAPRFHARVPRHGFATDPQNGRMIWACHFVTDIVRVGNG
jgi:sulfur relay (sulfurtransferase) DsrC/TusE family protein